MSTTCCMKVKREKKKKKKKRTTIQSSLFYSYPLPSFFCRIFFFCLSVLVNYWLKFFFSRRGCDVRNRLQQPSVKYVSNVTFLLSIFVCVHFFLSFSFSLSFASVIISLCGSAIYRSSSRRCAVGLYKKIPDANALYSPAGYIYSEICLTLDYG
jgi:hypothetical protein